MAKIKKAQLGSLIKKGVKAVKYNKKPNNPTHDHAKAKEKLGWEPVITAQEMCTEMVAEDLAAAQRLALLRAHGHHLAVPRETN